MRYYQNGNLVRFDDVVTPWDITSYAFKCFMTTWGVGDKGEWCDYPLITAIMKKVGYKVSFITNQFASTSNQGTICDLSGGFFLMIKGLLVCNMIIVMNECINMTEIWLISQYP